MFETMSLGAIIGLILALAFVMAFEFINGFHDTANAVATVIYTKAMSPYRAVILSGVFNFLGVLLGGVGVAYAIVHLLPVELLINLGDGSKGLAMVFSLLAAAIIWNLGTWFLGIPASSSHTLIGAILGVGITNTIINHVPVGDGINWSKAVDVLLSLIVSPLAGFIIAGLILLILKYQSPNSRMHDAPKVYATPELRIDRKIRKKPPFWNRFVLVLSAVAVSFCHGSNDGQKGVGLIMLVLICFVPAQYVIDVNASPRQITHTRQAIENVQTLFLRHQASLTAKQTPAIPAEKPDSRNVRCEITNTLQTLQSLRRNLAGITHFTEMDISRRVQVRSDILCLNDMTVKLSRLPGLTAEERKDLASYRKDLTASTEYAPVWVIFAIALSLGLGTVVGWKRVVYTVGERIGKQGMTYAQGMSAQITAALAIGAANLYSLPVSTTHILSSGVAGTMVANKTGIQMGAVKSIVIAWILTFPVAMLLGALFFWIANVLL